MEHIEIKQIIKDTWEGNDGKPRTDVLGLGDDNNLYRWHKGTGKWVLYVLS